MRLPTLRRPVAVTAAALGLLAAGAAHAGTCENLTVLNVGLSGGTVTGSVTDGYTLTITSPVSTA